MVTLFDVTREANISKMTVSRAINYPEQITPKLLALVEKAITKLDYHSNSIARALVSNRINVIKLVTLGDIDMAGPYHMDLLFGVVRGLKADSYVIQLITDIDQIQKGNTGDYITTEAHECSYPVFDRLKKPFILFGETPSSFDFVDTDSYYSTAIATKYTLVHGYKNAVLIRIDVEEGLEYAREYEYLVSIQEYSLEPQIFRTSNRSHLVEKLIDEQIERIRPNTCLIYVSDRLTIGVCRVLARLNKKMPEDCGVISFDGVSSGRVASPQLTTAEQRIFKIGDMLAQLILEKIKQSSSAQGQTYMKSESIVWGTTRWNTMIIDMKNIE